MRDYFGLINGTIPRFVTEVLPFSNMCCDFIGNMPRYVPCGCCVYEYDEQNNYLLNTPCRHNGEHKEIEYDYSFARWSVPKYRIPEILERIAHIEQSVDVNTYVYFDEDDREIYFRNIQGEKDTTNAGAICNGLDEDTNYKIFTWIVLYSIVDAFNKYQLNDTLVFTSEC